MATLTVRNVDVELMARLRVRAAMHGRSMEEELRSILREALQRPVQEKGLGQRLTKRFAAVATDIELPSRSLPRDVPVWDER